MSGIKYEFSSGVIEFKTIISKEKWAVTYNGVFQYTLGDGTIFIKRLTEKQLNIPEWDNCPELFDTNALSFI